jgi:predicted RNA-binding protein with PIN domain
LVAYLVDGNNVMGQRVGWHRDKAGARRRLLGELAQFARSAGGPVAVVFDGAPDAATPDGSVHDGVRVYYAARGSDADTRIAQLVESAVDRHALRVVTSDRRLADAVRRGGAAVVRAGDLRRHLDTLGQPTTEDGPHV